MRHLKLTCLLFLLISFFANKMFAQNDTTLVNKHDQRLTKKAEKTNKPPQKGDIYLSPLPIFAANPAFGFIYGAGAATSWFMGDPRSTKLSSAAIGISHTTKKQTIFTLKSTIFSEDNNMIFMGDWRYLNSSQPTWGLGTGPQSAKLAGQDIEFDDGKFTNGIDQSQMMTFKFFRFHETVFKNVGTEGLYAGLGIHIDLFNDIDDQLLDIGNEVFTSYYYYNEESGFDNEKSTLIGVSANALYDTRDNINNPYEGRYALAQFKYNPTWLGSDKNSTSLWLEYRDYIKLTEGHKNILAIWALGNFTTSGKLPYMNLPAIAWDQYGKSGAPYSQGRFRGHDLLFAGMEFRKGIWGSEKNPDLFGVVLFANATTASGYKNDIQLFEYIEPGYGLGLRFNISKKARTNLGLDYGWGNYGTQGFFLRLNENF